MCAIGKKVVKFDELDTRNQRKLSAKEMWIFSTWRWNSRGELRWLRGQVDGRASRRDWKGLGQTVVPEKWMEGQKDRAGFPIGHAIQKDCALLEQILQNNPRYNYKGVRIPPPLTSARTQFSKSYRPGCFTDAWEGSILLSFQRSLIQGMDFDQHNGSLQKVLFGVWINLKVTGVR